MNHLKAAQNIFIGREPQRAFGLLLDEDALNGTRRDLRAHAPEAGPAGPGRRAHRRQAADGGDRQGAVFESRVLIMDEPTAALNNAEIEELFRIIRQLRAKASASSTSRTRWTS